MRFSCRPTINLPYSPRWAGQGRVHYTLITPESPPIVTEFMMGPNAAAGETCQVVANVGVWKVRHLLVPGDVDNARSRKELEEILHCLITEVVVPRFEWADHEYLTREGLEKMFEGNDKAIAEYALYMKPSKSLH